MNKRFLFSLFSLIFISVSLYTEEKSAPPVNQEELQVTAHNLFDQAKRHQELKQYDEALSCYEQRITLGGSEEEIYWSYLQIGHIHKTLKKSSEIVIADYFKAYRYQPNRSEALYGLCEILNQQHEYILSYALLKSYTFIPKQNQKNSLFHTEWIDAWGLQFQLSLCSYYIGNYQESLTLCDTLLQRTDLPPEYRATILQNRAFPENKLLEKAYVSTYTK